MRFDIISKLITVILWAVSFLLSPQRLTMDGLGKLTLILAFFLLVSGKTEAKIATGNIDSELNVVYLDQFYFGNDGNNVMTYEMRYPSDQCCYKLVAFDDSASQWTYIRPFEDRLSCEYRLDRVKDQNFKISLSTVGEVCENEIDDNGRKWLSCRGRMDFTNRDRPRWSFIHLTNCQPRNEPLNDPGIWNLTFKLHMTNGDGAFHREFSANRKLMLETDIGYLLVYLVMTFIGTRYGMTLSKRRFLHLTYKLFYLSLICQMTSLSLHSLGLYIYARSGIEIIPIQDTAEMLSCLSCIVFVSMLLLVAKGYSITRVHITTHGTVKLIIVIAIYASMYILCFVYQQVLLDPRDILRKFYTNAAGGLIALKLIVFMLLTYGVFFTLKDHPRKAPFYGPFIVFFGIWSLTEPTCTLLAVYSFPILNSENLLNLISLTVTFCGHAYFIFLTRPHDLNKRFPFHIRTNKIGIHDRDEEDPDSTDRLDFVSEREISRPSSSTTVEIPDHYDTPVVPFDAELPSVSAIVTGGGDNPTGGLAESADLGTDNWTDNEDTISTSDMSDGTESPTNFYAPKGGMGIFCVEKPKTEAFPLASGVISDTAVDKKDPSIPYSTYNLTPVISKVKSKKVDEEFNSDESVYQVSPRASSSGSSVASSSVPYSAATQAASEPAVDHPDTFQHWYNDPELTAILESDPGDNDPPKTTNTVFKPKTQAWTKERPADEHPKTNITVQKPKIQDLAKERSNDTGPTKTTDDHPGQRSKLPPIERKAPVYYQKIDWGMIFDQEELLQDARPQEAQTSVIIPQRSDEPSTAKSGPANNGDTPKKIRREPTYRRFAKPGTKLQDQEPPTLEENDAQDTASAKQTKKSKKRRLKKFLKMARKRKPKSQNPEQTSSAIPPVREA